MDGNGQDFNRVPHELQGRDQWLLWDASAETPRRPHWDGDFTVSWSDPDAWHSFSEAVECAQRVDTWGIGYVTGIDNPSHRRGLYGVIDIDGGVDADGLKEWVPSLDQFIEEGAYMEYSPSGEGIHIPVVGQHKPSWFSDVQFEEADHEGVDYLTNKFCTFTGDTLDVSGSEVAEFNIEPWLTRAYKNVAGELPRSDSTGASSDYEDEEFLDTEDVRDALSQLDPDMGHGEWIRVGFAVHAFDSSSHGRDLFEEWSRRGEKFDRNAERQIGWIWDNATPEDGITVATLVHKAKESGWSPPSPKQTQTKPVATTDGGVATAAPQTESDEEAVELTPTAIVERNRYDPDEVDLSELKSSEIAFGVDRILQDHDDWHFLVIDDSTEDIYTFHDHHGIWRLDGERRLKRVCRTALRNQNKKTLHSEVVYQIQGNPNYTIDRESLGAPDGYIATPDGLLDLLRRDIEPIRPEDRAINLIATSYRPSVGFEGSRWQEFLEEAVHPGDREKLQEYAGYALWHHAQPFGKALFLVGPTNSGKGTFLKAISNVIGEENIAHESLYDLLQTRWGAARIFGKMVNIRNEVTPGGLKNVQKFKELTGGEDTLSAEKKGQDKFDFKVTQKFLFATNQMPDVSNTDSAFYERCLFAAFPNTVPREEQDPNLLDDLADEAPIILNWMLDGLDRLMRQGHFTNERSEEDKDAMIVQHGDSIDRFVHEVLDVSGESEDAVHKGDLYELYTRYCDFHRRDPEVQQTFTRELKANQGVDDGQSRRVGEDDDRTRVYTGIQVSERVCAELQHDVPRHATSDDPDESQASQQQGLDV